jgi:poly-beta-1,6-N-acetyl-D-glucosamine synthase
VSGKYTVMKPNEVDIGPSEDIYWKYETFLKTREAELSSTVGGHGHLHAIRTELYPYPPPGTVNDDYIIHASVISKGWRAVYEPEAIIREEAREMTGFGRRVRIMAGNIQQLREIGPLLRPLRPLPFFFFLGRKALRLVAPFAMIAALISNLFLLNRPPYQLLFIGQACFYILAIVGAFTKLRPKLFMLPYYFSMINAAMFLGTYHALTGLRTMKWK